MEDADVSIVDAHCHDRPDEQSGGEQ